MSNVHVSHQKFFDLARELFMIADFEGRILQVNPAWEKLLGHAKSEIEGRLYLDFIHPPDVVRTKGEARSLETDGEGTLFFENRYVTKTGELRWLRWASRTEGTLIYAVARDVTAEKEALEQLKHEKKISEFERAQLNELFLQAPAMVAVAEGPELVLTLVNKGYSTLFGGRQVVGKSVFEAIPDLDPEIKKTLLNVYRTGERFVATNLPMTADWEQSGKPKTRYFTFIYEPKRNPDGVVNGIICFATDNTEAIENAQKLKQSEKLASLGQISAAIGHEINNPLAYAMTNAELALKAKDPHRHLTQILDALERIRTTVRSLKAFSRGELEAKTRLQLSKCIDDALRLTANEVRHRAYVNLELADEGAIVLANGHQLTQVFINLLVNSAHAIPEGATDRNSIGIKAWRSNGNVIAEIRDTGCGIPAENLEKVLEPFFSSKPEGNGTGLGLSISNEIVQAFGGRLEIESEVGRGTLVRIILPECEAMVSPLQHQAAIDGPLTWTARQRLLIVEDDVNLGKALSESLSESFDVTLSSQPKNVASLLAAESFDLILCDVMMPEMSGMDLYEQIKSTHPGLERKMIFMTGGAFLPKLADWLNAIPNARIDKPFRAAALQKILGAEPKSA